MKRHTLTPEAPHAGVNRRSSAPNTNAAYENKVIAQLSLVGIIGNIILSAFKFIAGIVGSSSALVSDGVHSLSDVFATFIALIGTKLGRRAADATHPYGHERFECVASLALGIILFVTALGIGISAIQVITSLSFESNEPPQMIALIAAIVSIIAKEAMFWYTRHFALKIGSSAFMADAWHHRSDAISSVGALIGVSASMMGFPIMDSIASLAIALLIIKLAFDITQDALFKMVDSSASPELEQSMRETVATIAGIVRIDSLTTRQFADKVYVDLEIAMDGTTSLCDAHDIAEEAEKRLEDEFSTIKHVMVHVNPV